MVDFYSLFAYPILYILPAYAANGLPVIFGGGKPLDMGIKIKGKRLFGNNKTVRGTLAALIAGIAVGAVEWPFLSYMLAISLLLAVGTIAGDLLGSFIKRRLGMGPGAEFIGMDQYGFFAVAILFALPLGHLPGAYGLLFLVLLTGALHVTTNRIAHMMNLKKVPW